MTAEGLSASIKRSTMIITETISYSTQKLHWNGQESLISITDPYVYQYATGYAAAIALSQRIPKEGEPAVQDYLSFLSKGCSEDPVSLLRGAGVDMASPAPVNDALKLFDQLVSELESLLTECAS